SAILWACARLRWLTRRSAARPAPASFEVPESNLAGRVSCSGWFGDGFYLKSTPDPFSRRLQSPNYPVSRPFEAPHVRQRDQGVMISPRRCHCPRIRLESCSGPMTPSAQRRMQESADENEDQSHNPDQYIKVMIHRDQGGLLQDPHGEQGESGSGQESRPVRSLTTAFHKFTASCYGTRSRTPKLSSSG